MAISLRRMDTAENRAHWANVDRASAYVRSHAMCFSTWCTVHGDEANCPKKPAQAKGAA